MVDETEIDLESTNPKKIETSQASISSDAASQDWVEKRIKLATGKVVTDAEEMIRKQVQLDKASLITVFGIFASIISFLTIEFQFLKTVCSFEKILGFTLILFSLLFTFNVALDYLVKSRLDKKTPELSKHFTSLIALFFLIGILLTYKGNEEFCRENEIYQRYSDEYDSNLESMNREIERKFIQLDSKIGKLETQNHCAPR
jgi:hypothetical protein